jgi:hypothetical protein
MDFWDIWFLYSMFVGIVLFLLLVWIDPLKLHEDDY